jgi:hypothetical protein
MTFNRNVQHNVEKTLSRAITLWLEDLQWELIWKGCEHAKLQYSQLGSPKTKNHFNIIHTTRSKVYYKEEGGDLLLSQGCMSNECKASLWPKV